MKIIDNKLWAHLSFAHDERYYNREIRTSEALEVKSYADLVQHIARVAFHNPGMSLFFRGQAADYRDKSGNSSLYPSLYRATPGNLILPKKTLEKRFLKLYRSSEMLRNRYSLIGKYKLHKFPEITWAILQHYEVCATPLLDITSSIRVASSFASMGDQEYGYIFVLGIPHINNSISYFTDIEMLNIKLQGICPPNAIRPFFQDGYLVGSFPLADHRSAVLNFSRRLVAKFRFKKANFWNEDFLVIPKGALYPEEDGILEMCMELKDDVERYFGD